MKISGNMFQVKIMCYRFGVWSSGHILFFEKAKVEKRYLAQYNSKRNNFWVTNQSVVVGMIEGFSRNLKIRRTTDNLI